MARRGLLALIATLGTSAAARADAPSVLVLVGEQQLDAAAVIAAWKRAPRSAAAVPALTDPIAFVNDQLVPGMLLAEHARRSLPGATSKTRDALAQAMLEALLRETSSEPADAAAVQQYYAAHRREFEQPQALRLWRILVNDEKTAKKIIANARGAKGREQWRDAARDASLDDATKYRSGDLGFVLADGQTLVPQVRVAPELYAAAAKVADGQIVPEPVSEGGKLAVVWRRGTRAAVSVPLGDATPAIQRALAHQRFQSAKLALLERLKAAHVRDYAPDNLRSLPKQKTVSVVPAAPNPSATPAASTLQPPEPVDDTLR